MQEQQAASLLAIVVIIKFVRRQSIDGFLSEAFFFSKSAISLLAWYMDLRLLAYYLIMFASELSCVEPKYIWSPCILWVLKNSALACVPLESDPLVPWCPAVVALLFPQPLFKGPARLEYLTPASFAEMIEERKDSDVSWLVEFFAPWAPECVFLEPVIAELSLKYTTPTRRFGKIDVSRWPAMASKYNISTTGMSNQLPTLIMFERGKEVGRIPHVDKDGKVAAGKFRRHDIITAFMLDGKGEKDAGKGGKSGSKKKR